MTTPSISAPEKPLVRLGLVYCWFDLVNSEVSEAKNLDMIYLSVCHDTRQQDNIAHSSHVPDQLPQPGLRLRGHTPAPAHGPRVDTYDLLPPRRVGHAHLLTFCGCVSVYMCKYKGGASYLMTLRIATTHTNALHATYLHMHLQPPRAQHGVVDHVLTVGKPDDQHIVEGMDAVELGEELVHYLFVFVWECGGGIACSRCARSIHERVQRPYNDRR